jgi:hypothetical protein
MNNTLFRHLPSAIVKTALSLENIGVDEYAWDWQDSIKIIETLTGPANKIPILGGDVYVLANGQFKHTGDSWFIEKAVSESSDVFLDRTRFISIAYIKTYTARNGENFFYSIVVQ